MKKIIIAVFTTLVFTFLTLIIDLYLGFEGILSLFVAIVTMGSFIIYYMNPPKE